MRSDREILLVTGESGCTLDYVKWQENMICGWKIGEHKKMGIDIGIHSKWQETCTWKYGIWNGNNVSMRKR